MELQIAHFSNKMNMVTGGHVRLIWSQPATREDRQRGLLPTALICIFLGGVVVNAGGRDAGQTPRVFRAAATSLLATGGVLFLVGGASLLLQKARRSGPTLRLAAPAGAGQEPESSLRKEDQQ
jgi:hypothetical protein